MDENMSAGQDVDDSMIDEDIDVNALQLVCFKMANEEYAMDITKVQEVIRVRKITPVPQMPEFSLGVINIRGNIVPVFDLRVRFGLSCKEVDKDSKILVANTDRGQIAFIVDAILDNIKLGSSSIDPSPTVKMSIDRECIQGIGEMESRMIVILDFQKVSDLVDKDVQEYTEGLIAERDN